LGSGRERNNESWWRHHGSRKRCECVQGREPPATPTIIGISPSLGATGQTLNVTISGAKTSFANGVSVANFGSGITVNSTTVLSGSLAIANITIASGAAIGYRNVIVTTGPELATENVIGPFLVIAPPPPIPRITALNPSQGFRGQTLNVLVTGENTHFVNGVSVASFSGGGVTGK